MGVRTGVFVIVRQAGERVERMCYYEELGFYLDCGDAISFH